MPTLSFSDKFSDTWSQYGLTEHPILFNGDKSNAKAILRNSNELITIVSDSYKLLPNQEALKIAAEAAKLADFVPFKFPKESWKQTTVEDNVIHNKNDTAVHAFYVPRESVPTSGNHTWSGGVVDPRLKDSVYVGVDIVNSIDGSRSFGAGSFSFRGICSNGAIFGFKQIGAISHVHTKGLENIVSQLKTSMVSLMDSGRQIMERYQQMAQVQATEELLAKIKKTDLPFKVLPAYLQQDEEQKQLAPVNLTQWDVYNDITAKIWHNVENDIGSKEQQFQQLHRVMLPPIQVY